MQPSSLSTLKAPCAVGLCSEATLYRTARDTLRQLTIIPEAMTVGQGVDMQVEQSFCHLFDVATVAAVVECADA